MSITVILNGYRRPQILAAQLKAIKDQSIPPDQVWLWINYHDDFSKNFPDVSGFDRVISNNFNWKYFGRFTIALMAQTKYIALFDDDTIPGPKWFENAINTHNQTNGVIGGVGLIQHDKTTYMNHTRYGWPSGNTETTKVDLVGHAWFFTKEHLRCFWSEEPVTYETAEDMHLSFTCQKSGFGTFVPPHCNREASSSLLGYELGVDHTTPSVTDHGNFFSLRDHCLQGYVERGWKLCQY